MLDNDGQMRNRTRQNAERGGHFATAPVTVPAANGPNPLKGSEFFRLPKPGARCPLSGLPRTSILEHGQTGDFKIVRLRKPHAKRGVVLVETSSFLKWLHQLPAVRKDAK
jgi:hypothetical protein